MRRRFELALGLSAALTATPAHGAEQHTLSPFPPMAARAESRTFENPTEGAEIAACVNRPDVFERGVLDNGTMNDGMRILSSISSYYFQRNVGTIDQQLARAGQYHTSLEGCSADDLRAAAFFINIWFPEGESETDPIIPIAISSRSFAIGEVQRRLREAVVEEQRSGV